jgi:hypothetical protein
MHVAIGAQLWPFLGWDTFVGDYYNEVDTPGGQVYAFRIVRLNYIGNGRWRNVAPTLPVKYQFVASNTGPNVIVRLENMSGTWTPQPQPMSDAEGIPSTVEGWLQFADAEIAGGFMEVQADGGTAFMVRERTASRFRELGFTGSTFLTRSQGSIINYREDEFTGNIRCKQIWYERRSVADTLLRIILSTGYRNAGDTAGYNADDYDVNPAGMGCAVPHSLIDVPSFESMGRDSWPLIVTKPTGFAQRLESALATFGRHLVWKRGKLTLVEPRVDGPTIAVAYNLTNDNKARIDDRVGAILDGGSIINRVEVKFDMDFNGSPQGTVAVDDAVSASDHGRQRTFSVEAWGVQSSGDGLPAVVSQLAGKVMAYFSRPLVLIQRTYTKSLMQIGAGDTVLVSDPYLVDPRTGARGMVNFPAWVMTTRFSPEGMAGVSQLAYSPDFPTDKICPWGWSGRVSEVAANAGYVVVDGSSRYIQLRSADYSAAGGANDDVVSPTAPIAGDKIRIRELSPLDPWRPLFWSRTVQSVDTVNHRLYLTAAIADWDADRIYIVTPDVITTPVVNEQRVNTYIADDATDSTGYAANDSYILGTPRFGEAKPLVIQGYCRPPRDGHATAAGHVLAVADVREAARSVNTLLSHRTRHLVWSQVWKHNAAATAGAGKELIAGPISVPLYAYGSRSILVRLFAKTTNVTYPATFTLTSSRILPQGPDAGPIVWTPEAYIRQVTAVASTTTKTWLAEVSLSADPEPGREPPMIFVTIEAETGNAAGSAELWGVSMFEDVGIQ